MEKADMGGKRDVIGRQTLINGLQLQKQMIEYYSVLITMCQEDIVVCTLKNIIPPHANRHFHQANPPIMERYKVVQLAAQHSYIQNQTGNNWVP
jgi:hypothetical protein